jgi:hypothetical protein
MDQRGKEDSFDRKQIIWKKPRNRLSSFAQSAPAADACPVMITTILKARETREDSRFRIYDRGLFLMVTAMWLAGTSAVQALDASTLTEVGLGLGSNPYWSRPAFANALWEGEGWLEYTNGQWGSSVFFENNPQFDTNGFPKYLNPGKKLRAIVFALNANPAPRPATWPDRTLLARGKVVITWRGDADIQANGGTYLSGESSGASTGRLVDGRRVYRFSGTARLGWITIEDINAGNPVSDIKVWLPDPADPDNLALENQLFHPTFLQRLGDANWAFLRFMDWNESNASPQQDWGDRRLPGHVFQQGVLNRRAPANGFGGDRGTGIAFEHMVALANAAGRDMWINVPHLATDDFITRLARLIRFGSDGVNPYTNSVANPVYPPLNANRRVFVEYSNEIWSSGDAFAQGNWAQDQANGLGITKPQFNARRFCQVWNIFQSVFTGQTDRVVRVAAVWTGLESYTDPFLNEIAAYGPTLTPPQTADVVAPTTYFGNGIQDWAYTMATQQAGTADPWFLTTNTFADGSTIKPVSLPADDPYWIGTNVTRHLAATFTEWKRRLLSGATQTGGGPDATGIGGGFDWWLRTSISNAFGTLKPIVAYEGGPSIYTDYLDGGDVRDDGITTFMELLNRQPQFANVYRVHLNLAKAKGLRTHSAFVDVGAWGKYGQWGHLEYADQDPNAAVKWRFIRDWPLEIAGLRSIDDPLGTSPIFNTPARLAAAVCSQPYSQDSAVTNGDGTLTLQLIDQLLTAGLTITNLPGNPPRLRVSGTPVSPGQNYFLARVNDSDGDPAWRTFYFSTVGGPGTILECNFEGTNPALTLPWLPTYVLQSGAVYSGWTKGAGIFTTTGNDALVWSQNMPADEPSSTLGLAISNNAYWQFTLTPPSGQPFNLRKAEVRFTIRRIDYHAPREYAVFTSSGGFTNGAQVFDTGHFTDDTDREFIFQLPDMAAYSNLTTAITFRLCGYSGQYAGHRTSLRAFKLTADPGTLPPFERWKASHGIPANASNGSDADNDGIPLLIEYALNLDPSTASSNGLPFGGINGGFLTLTYTRVKAATDITYTAEVSGSATGAWSSAATDVDQAWLVNDQGETEAVTARDKIALSNAPSRYLRLKVSQP